MRRIRVLALLALVVVLTCAASVAAGGAKIGILVVIRTSDADMLARAGVVAKQIATMRRQAGYAPRALPIIIYRFDAVAAEREFCQKAGIGGDRLMFLGVVSLGPSGGPRTILSRQVRVGDAEAAAKIAFADAHRRVGGRVAHPSPTSTPPTVTPVRPPLHTPATIRPMRFACDHRGGGFVRVMEGWIDDPQGLWDALAPLQPPKGAHGDYGLIGDDGLLGQEQGYGLRTLGAVARRYLRFTKFHFEQPSGWERLGVQAGVFSDPAALSDASLGWAFFDVRRGMEEDLKIHLGR